MFSCRLLIRITDTGGFRNIYRSLNVASGQSPIFKPRTALILAKLSKYDCEKSSENYLNDDQLRKSVEKKGFNAQLLIARHETHYAKLSELLSALKEHGLKVHVVDRRSYSLDSVSWADVVFTAGGDGTFLLGASKILHPNKPVIGFNTDPSFSHGFLCLPKWCSLNVSTAVDLLLSNHFRWLRRQRIRVTLTHSKSEQLKVQPLDKNKPINQDSYEIGVSNDSLDLSACQLFPSSYSPADMTTTVLPVFALNEVFAGESLSACVSVYDISVDGKKSEKQKSSGVVISTGTGSTSWSQQINKISKSNIMELLKIVQQINPSFSISQSEDRISSLHRNGQHSSYSNLSDNSKLSNNSSLELLTEMTETMYSESLIFDPEDCKMMYTVRDPLNNAIFKVTHSRGFTSNLYIRSLMDDGHLVFDSGLTFPFSSGSIAKFTVLPTDSLCCVQFDVPC
ncbi:unnamed protein product [Heterobilharzia americana]|nr:unnamed protein product [Heterobilharzia americana]